MLRAALVLSILFCGVAALLLTSAEGNPALGEDGAPAGAVDLEAQVKSLEQQVAYLLERDAALTVYVLRNAERGARLQQVVRQTRAQGFENRAIPVSSRITLLNGLDALGNEWQRDLPKVTKAQAAMLKAASR